MLQELSLFSFYLLHTPVTLSFAILSVTKWYFDGTWHPEWLAHLFPTLISYSAINQTKKITWSLSQFGAKKNEAKVLFVIKVLFILFQWVLSQLLLAAVPVTLCLDFSSYKTDWLSWCKWGTFDYINRCDVPCLWWVSDFFSKKIPQNN